MSRLSSAQASDILPAMQCQACQAENAAEQRYCGQCAAPLAASPQSQAKALKTPEKIGPAHLALIALIALILVYRYVGTSTSPSPDAKPTPNEASGAWEGKNVAARGMHVCGGELSDSVMAHNAGIDKDRAGLDSLIARGKVVVISPGDKATIILTRREMARVRWTSGAAIGQRCWSPLAALQ